MEDTLWNAYVTVHWFATGNEILCDSDDPFTEDSYQWYLELENRAFEREVTEYD